MHAAQREAAIVSSTPGTTRDVVELSLDFHGYPIVVADTAGLRKTGDEIEAIGVERAQAKAAEADLKLCVLSLPAVFPDAPGATTPLVASISPLTLAQIDASTVILLNKTDQVGLTEGHYCALEVALEGKKWAGMERVRKGFVEVSVTEGKGLDNLVERLKVVLKER